MRAKTTSADRHRPKLQAGFSLIELMISITVGLLILGTLTTVFLQGSKSRADNDRIGRQIESGRYAMQLLSRDLQQAGYLAEFNPALTGSTPVATPAVKPDPCDISLSGLVAALSLHLQGYDNGAGTPSCLSDVRAGSDVVVIRRASGCIPGAPNCDALASGDYIFQASLCANAAELSAVPAVYYKLTNVASALTLHKRNCTTVSNFHRYLTRIYFVANNNQSGDGIPTLKRAELGPTGLTIVPLVDGIENIQLEYGLDLNSPATGAASVFTANPDTYNSCSSITTPTCTAYWRSAVSVNIHVLARNIDATAGYSDSKTYVMGSSADGTAKTLGPYQDAYGRHVYQAVARLYNPSGRSATQ